MNGPSNFTGLAVSIVLFSGYVLCGSPSLDNVTKLFRGLDFVKDARRKSPTRLAFFVKQSQNVSVSKKTSIAQSRRKSRTFHSPPLHGKSENFNLELLGYVAYKVKILTCNFADCESFGVKIFNFRFVLNVQIQLLPNSQSPRSNPLRDCVTRSLLGSLNACLSQ